MNKEVKELIEQLEEYASGGGSGLYPFEESVKALLDYINQLETNRDEAIRMVKSNNVEVLKYYGEPSETGSYELVTTELLSLLERGKE